MLTFESLRAANRARLPRFKNAKGERYHTEVDGSEWTPAQWLQAVVGELGEYANLRKKFERGDIDAFEFQRDAGKELADVLIYLDILALNIGLRLDEQVINKFNIVSQRVGANVWLKTDDEDDCINFKAYVDGMPAEYAR